jgi:DNA-binding LacI/PurR family transcriptional regulator
MPSTMTTQKEIASQLGVSPSLVSRVLTGTAGEIGVREETIQRIREVATKFNYHPSAAALTLRGRSANTLGVIVRDFEDPFFGHMIGELHALSWMNEYSLVLTGCPTSRDGQVDLAALLKYHLDGLIVMGSNFEPEGLEAFTDKHVPIVRIGTSPHREGVLSIAMDQESGLDQIVVYLQRLGHRDIGYIGSDTAFHIRREEVLSSVLKNRDLAIRPNACVRAPPKDTMSGYEAMRRLLHQCQGLLPTAVIAADDVIGQGGLRALFEQGIIVPTDLSLVGIDDIPSARMMIPALTTLRQPIKEMIQQAFELLTNPARSIKTPSRDEIVVRPELIIRESCAAPRARDHTRGRI